MLRSFKIRLFPTGEQEHLLWKHVNASRFIYNYMLELQNKRHENGESQLSEFGMKAIVPDVVSENEWLKEISSMSLRNTCRDLANNFQRFFNRKAGKPKFKSKKRSKKSFPVRSDRMYFNDKYVQIEKVGKIKYKTDLCVSKGNHACKFIGSRITFKNDKWFLTFSIERENQAVDLNDYCMGIDLGIKELAVVAYDDKNLVFHNINKSHRIKTLERKLKIIQHKISHKYEKNKRGCIFIKTRNIERLEIKLRYLYERITNIRENYIHQTTSALVKLKPKRVTMETLSVKNLMKNKHLSNAFFKQKLAEFIRQMRYKCENYGIEFVQVDRFYPSSKTCSCCGNIKKILKLSERTYNCDVCGLSIDRDLNAAINLMRYNVQ